MRTCWDWCTRKHKHTFTEGPGHGYTPNDFIHTEERTRVTEQSGWGVERRSDLNARLRATGQRLLEAGEPGDRMRRDVAEWVRSGGESSGSRPPEMRDYFPPSAPRHPVDVRRLFHDNLERAKAKYGR